MRRTWSAHHHLAWRMRIYFHHCYCSWTAVVVAVGDVHPGHRVMAASAAYYAVMVHQEAFHVHPLGYWDRRVASSSAEAWHSCQSSSCTWKGNGMTLECVIIYFRDKPNSPPHILLLPLHGHQLRLRLEPIPATVRTWPMRRLRWRWWSHSVTVLLLDLLRRGIPARLTLDQFRQ